MCLGHHSLADTPTGGTPQQPDNSYGSRIACASGPPPASTQQLLPPAVAPSLTLPGTPPALTVLVLACYKPTNTLPQNCKALVVGFPGGKVCTEQQIPGYVQSVSSNL